MYRPILRCVSEGRRRILLGSGTLRQDGLTDLHEGLARDTDH